MLYFMSSSERLAADTFTYCVDNPIKYLDANGENAATIPAATSSYAAYWTGTAWSLCALDGPLPIGDIIFVVGIGVCLVIDNWDQINNASASVIATLKNLGAQTIVGIKYVGGRAVEGLQWVSGKLAEGATWAGEKIVDSATWVGTQIVAGSSWVWNKVTGFFESPGCEILEATATTVATITIANFQYNCDTDASEIVNKMKLNKLKLRS